MSAISDIEAERRRQVEVEGWTTEHDDHHDQFEMTKAAVCYALAGDDELLAIGRFSGTPELWPWGRAWWKPTNRRRDLIKAAALIVAEIERIDRKSEKDGSQP